MNKFQKRLSKLTKNKTSALVIGTAFGQISQILSMYSTVFVVNEDALDLKAKNLIYRETIDRLDYLVNVGIVFLDMKHIDKLENLQTFWKKNNSLVLIEGNDAISRDLSKPLYDSGWHCTSLQGWFHVWEQYRK
jgi:ribonucleotide monophosphatase NagD (HAD superfamily)